MMYNVNDILGMFAYVGLMRPHLIKITLLWGQRTIFIEHHIVKSSYRWGKSNLCRRSVHALLCCSAF